jgi:putative DNA primase/helicase
MIEQEEAPVGKGGGSEAQETCKSNNANGRGSEEGNPPGQIGGELQVPTGGEELLDDTVALLRRHLSLQQGAAEVMALWVLFAHCLDSFDASPRLALLSPVHECGKTKALGLIKRLVPRPLAASNATPAAVFRVIDKEKSTLLIDEADSLMEERAELANILKSGHTRDTASVLRCSGDDHEARQFGTWAAIAIAKIGKLEPALESRSIVIEMRRSKPSEKVEPVTSATERELELLRERAERWTAAYRGHLRSANPTLPSNFRGRLADNWRPLFAIADAAGGQWPDRARSAAREVTGDTEPPEATRLLSNVRRAFKESGADKLSSIDLCNALKALSDDTFWTQVTLAKALKPFGIRPKSDRVDIRSTPKGYQLKDFEDAFSRYLDPEQQEFDFDHPPADRNSATSESYE